MKSNMIKQGSVVEEFVSVRDGNRRKFYCLVNGRYRHVPTAEILSQYVDPETVKARKFKKIQKLYKWGPELPNRKLIDTKKEDVKYSHHMRQKQFSDLSGEGMEFGAGPRPAQVPITCSVQYADIYNKEEFVAQSSAARGLRDSKTKYVDIDIVDDMVSMKKIDDSSLDFIIGAHVIEHLRNPLKAFEMSHRKLRPGGVLALVIPDKERTFDRPRKLTTLDHLIEDYEEPRIERDLEHYMEFQTLVKTPGHKDAQELAFKRWQASEDTHFHVWNFDTFCKFADFVCQKFNFSISFSHNGHGFAKPTNEFYFSFKANP